MCDTLGFTNHGRTVFGKNSDRSPNEVQVLEYHPAALHSEEEVNATYISIPQVRKTHGVLLSRPAWMWGAEIGVNDCGVCIGNEAVFTLGRYGRTGLTGMDLLRASLERSSDAEEAVSVITELLEAYGQGGNCGYDHDFYYDNSFLVADPGNILVLETAGRDWVCKKYERASISNRLSIGKDGDSYSGKVCNFKLRHTEQVYTAGSGSAARRFQTQSCLGRCEDVEDVFTALRTHDRGVKNPFSAGTVSSACMHFGGAVGDHTTASMAATLETGRTVVWATGSSTPCVSLFKPWLFGTEPVTPVFAPDSAEAQEYWLRHEEFRRGLIGKIVPDEYYAERDSIESQWLRDVESAAAEDFPELSRKCALEEKEFFGRWSSYEFEKAQASSRFMKRWDAKNGVLFHD